MPALAAALADLVLERKQAVHGAYGAVIPSFIEQDGIDGGRRDIHEAIAIEDLEKVLAFGVTQGERGSGTRVGC
jgi:hypothetical protein